MSGVMTAKLLAELQRRSALTFAQALAKYRPDQERDELGRFADEGGGDTRAMVARTGRGRRKTPPKPRRTAQQVADDKVLDRLRRASRASANRKYTSSKEEVEQRAVDYAHWLARRDGIELPQRALDDNSPDRHPQVEWAKIWNDQTGKNENRVKSVNFPGFSTQEYVQPPKPKNWSRLTASERQFARMGKWVTHTVEGVRINIPNWDHVPIVTRGNRADYDE